MQRNEKGQTLEAFLKAYNPNAYEKPSVTVDVALFTSMEGRLYLLLIKRKDHPFIGKWALPGGFINMDEGLKDAALRELAEETGITANLTELGVYGAVDRDPRMRVITVGYVALAKEGSITPVAGDDAADARLFGVSIHMQPNALEIELVNGEQYICVNAKLARANALSGYKAEYAQGDLASDHALIISDACLRITTSLPECVAGCLTEHETNRKKLTHELRGYKNA